MTFWFIGSRQQVGRSILTPSRLPELPTIDVRKLTDAQIKKCNGVFDRLKNRSFLPASEAYRDNLRIELDTALFEILKLSKDMLISLDVLRLKWCAEPSVHGGSTTRPQITI